MTARVPSDAILKSARGEITVGDIQPGDSFIAYDPVSRQPGFITVEAADDGVGNKVGLNIASYRWINLMSDTMAYTSGGPQPVSNTPSYFLTFCPINPLRMSTRNLADFAEYGNAPVVRLSWPGDNLYLWCEGLLIGSK